MTGSITKVCDCMVTTALYEAANVMLTRTVRFSSAKAWGMAVARRRGTNKARVALARKLNVILHRMWVDGSFRGPTKRQSPKKESFEDPPGESLRHRGPVAGTVKLVKPPWQK